MPAADINEIKANSISVLEEAGSLLVTTAPVKNTENMISAVDIHPSKINGRI